MIKEKWQIEQERWERLTQSEQAMEEEALARLEKFPKGLTQKELIAFAEMEGQSSVSLKAAG